MDPVSMSVGLLASTAVKVLGPYLGELAGKASDALLGKVAEDAASSAFKAAGRLLGLVKEKFRGKDEAEKSLEVLASAPGDPAAQAAVEKNLKTELERDPDFASALAGHLTQIANTHADVAFVNNIQGDVEKIAQFGTVHGDVTF
jgi:hypothetical protein